MDSIVDLELHCHICYDTKIAHYQCRECRNTHCTDCNRRINNSKCPMCRTDFSSQIQHGDEIIDTTFYRPIIDEAFVELLMTHDALLVELERYWSNFLNRNRLFSIGEALRLLESPNRYALLPMEDDDEDDLSLRYILISTEDEEDNEDNEDEINATTPLLSDFDEVD